MYVKVLPFIGGILINRYRRRYFNLNRNEQYCTDAYCFSSWTFTSAQINFLDDRENIYVCFPWTEMH